ncbi:mitogen-activated protein kinase kinase kinase 1a [Selaginella moellendorffii]|uniref:mitogen-activated protein kinase kinase kinase 1a n=1 Tax=Selaginella moellendorffii TaxID=88036 RepID=UPI000D1C55BA|nr:mitogen-activated protein kinase kinase kinase 1a [Selaginella moellendorffii]|eukprot:XP_024528466.1 mitogen-activated protein kinase kinase kinase 1a [Selaginella moellendorffii]
MEKDFSHSGSSGRRRLDRVNALGRNTSYNSTEPGDEKDLFRLDGDDDESVSNMLSRIGITRPDMLGIPASEWNNRMSRPSSGELQFRGHPEAENPSTKLVLPSRLGNRTRSFEPPFSRNSLEVDQPRSYSLEEKSREDTTRQLSPLSSSPDSPSTSYDRDRGEAQAAVSDRDFTFLNDGSSDSRSHSSSGDGGEDKGRSMDSQASDDTHPTEAVDYEQSPQPTSLTTRLSWSSWKKLELLGSGSFGSVYRAVGSDGNYFAVKEVPLSNANDQSGLQLQQEVNLLGNLRHENIVQYLGTQKTKDKLYIFLELVTQGSIVSQYKHFEMFDEQIRKYTKQILSGLKYLHEKKVVHRDIKCANILVHAHGTVKLADFGMAKQLEKIDSMRSCKGSVYWMAPEVINPKKTAGFPADIWSLGCTVLEMATGKPPFSDWEWNTVFFRVGRGALPEIPDSIQGDARDFILECLQADPSKRPTASKLLDHPFVNSRPVVDTTGLVTESTEIVSAYDSWGVSARTETGRTARSVRTRQSIYHNQ